MNFDSYSSGSAFVLLTVVLFTYYGAKAQDTCRAVSPSDSIKIWHVVNSDTSKLSNYKLVHVYVNLYNNVTFIGAVYRHRKYLHQKVTPALIQQEHSIYIEYYCTTEIDVLDRFIADDCVLHFQKKLGSKLDEQLRHKYLKPNLNQDNCTVLLLQISKF
jgi:hypothetical protein